MGRTPFHYAAICNDGGQYYDLLKQHGADSSVFDLVKLRLLKKLVKPLIKKLFQNGNTPEYYASNKTELDFNELIEFVEKRKAMPTDSGRSSSMSLSQSSNVAGNYLLKTYIFGTYLLSK